MTKIVMAAGAAAKVRQKCNSLLSSDWVEIRHIGVITGCKSDADLSFHATAASYYSIASKLGM